MAPAHRQSQVSGEAPEGESSETPQLPVEEMGLRGQDLEEKCTASQPWLPSGFSGGLITRAWGALPEVREEEAPDRMRGNRTQSTHHVQEQSPWPSALPGILLLRKTAAQLFLGGRRRSSAGTRSGSSRRNSHQPTGTSVCSPMALAPAGPLAKGLQRPSESKFLSHRNPASSPSQMCPRPGGKTCVSRQSGGEALSVGTRAQPPL